MVQFLLDLDCVLADFVGGYARWWGLDPKDVYSHWSVGHYPMNEAVGKSLGRGPLTDIEFWERVNGDSQFWELLEPLPWMKRLIQEVERYDRNWHVVSSPSHCPSSYLGKTIWLKNQFGSKFNRFALTPHKYLFAKPGVILIDDHEKNVETFREAGGEAILFPAHHNVLHRYKEDPLSYVTARLEAFRLRK